MNHTQPSFWIPKRPMKLSTSVSLLVSAVIAVVLLTAHLFYFFQISHSTQVAVKDKALAVARTLALSPEIQQGLQQEPADGIIQKLTDAAQSSNHLLFVVATNMDGIRYSHPDKNLINRHFIGDDLLPALKGHENVAINTGKLGVALRVFTPVFDQHGRQIGVIAIGISLSELTQQISHSRWNILWIALFGILVGTMGTYLLVKAAKRILLGLEPFEISALFEQHQAMLQSMKEGVIAVDDRMQATLINRAARQLLRETGLLQALECDNDEIAAASGPLIDKLHSVMRSGTARRDEEINFNGRILLCNTMPVRNNGIIIGAICTFRDKTEIIQLLQRLDGMVTYIDALRERSHEFMNKLHVILGLTHMKSYNRLEEYILKTAHSYHTEIGSLLGKIKSPVIAGFLLSKISRAYDTGNHLAVNDDSLLPETGSEQQVAVLITVLGNLIENALDAAGENGDGDISVLLHYQNGWLSCEVSDDGPGIEMTRMNDIFAKGYSTKGDNRGVGLFLVKQQTESLGGKIIVESEPGVYTQFFVQLPWDGENKNA
ncbi:sensor histidine kinase [Erwinia tasmaniensis]|uniref:histidine kinase n=1 Tax=Erwinia tasmaniensis (strain DSM 17950 / CFBP 7177 / CIP 109463 / NCPPB 4357 / Et1/99) TaxID=465817 RepID=B2VIE3_ERWT9|nr:sensor histidine kinase [Erwinia tasmaniensis]CAO96969.1 Sensor protein [Erwinia tasmaniensis Et1/99]